MHKSKLIALGNNYFLSDAEYQNILTNVKPYFPRYVKINRIQRIFPEGQIADGPRVVIDRSRYVGQCACFLHRTMQLPELTRVPEYRVNILPQADGAFIEAVDGSDNLLGFLRVRIDKELSLAMLREIRVYGISLPPNSSEIGVGILQHQGIGRHLMSAMEKYRKNMVLKKFM